MAEHDDADRDVLTSLPRSRPVRRSSKRPDRAVPENDATAAAKPAPQAPKATTPGGAKTPGPRARAARAKAAAAQAGPAAPAQAGAAQAGAAQTAPAAVGDGTPPRVAPPRKIPPAGYAAPEPRSDERSPSPAADLIGTTLQAAGELAQIGVSLGRQTLQSLLERLPKP
ncbi:MAG TPA: hypothetical protein VHZ75_05065 [Solirubrobacteraceae bacterium]|nr:hypothetical protein [Solirubrobacteraceae bacterium]